MLSVYPTLLHQIFHCCIYILSVYPTLLHQLCIPPCSINFVWSNILHFGMCVCEMCVKYRSHLLLFFIFIVIHQERVGKCLPQSRSSRRSICEFKWPAIDMGFIATVGWSILEIDRSIHSIDYFRSTTNSLIMTGNDQSKIWYLSGTKYMFIVWLLLAFY